jgi:hypothetical protein
MSITVQLYVLWKYRRGQAERKRDTRCTDYVPVSSDKVKGYLKIAVKDVARYFVMKCN